MPSEHKDFYDSRATAAMLDISVRTLYSLGVKGWLVPVHPTGTRAKRYARADIERFISERRSHGKPRS